MENDNLSSNLNTPSNDDFSNQPGDINLILDHMELETFKQLMRKNYDVRSKEVTSKMRYH